MKTTIKKYFLTLSIIYFFFNFIIIAFGIVSFLINSEKAPVYDFRDPLFISCVSLFFMEVVASTIILKKSNVKMRSSYFESKFLQYQTKTIIALALFEGVALFSVVGIFVTFNLYLLGITILSLLIMFNHMPSKSKFCQEANLTYEELQLIADDNYELIIPKTNI